MQSDPAKQLERNARLMELLARTALADQRAFAELYRLTSPHLYAVALRILREAAPAEEVLQESFVNIWHHAEESILKTAQLLRIDLSRIVVDEKPFTQILGAFSEQLKRIKSALESRDFVALTDTLAYEMTQTAQQWRGASKTVVGQHRHGRATEIAFQFLYRFELLCPSHRAPQAAVARTAMGSIRTAGPIVVESATLCM